MGKGFRVHREEGHHRALACSSKKISRIELFFLTHSSEEKIRDWVLTLNSEASEAGSILYSVNSNCIIFFWIQYYAEMVEPSSWKSLLHTWYFFRQKRECLSKPSSVSKEPAVHLFAYRSTCCQKKPLWNKSFQKLAWNIVGKESTIETLPKKVACKGQELQRSKVECCLHSPFTEMGRRSH